MLKELQHQHEKFRQLLKQERKDTRRALAKMFERMEKGLKKELKKQTLKTHYYYHDRERVKVLKEISDLQKKQVKAKTTASTTPQSAETDRRHSGHRTGAPGRLQLVPTSSYSDPNLLRGAHTPETPGGDSKRDSRSSAVVDSTALDAQLREIEQSLASLSLDKKWQKTESQSNDIFGLVRNCCD